MALIMMLFSLLHTETVSYLREHKETYYQCNVEMQLSAAWYNS